MTLDRTRHDGLLHHPQVEQWVFLRRVQRALQLPDERIQRRDDACLGDRVYPQPVRVLDACRAVVGPSGVVNNDRNRVATVSTWGAAAARAAAAENADGLPSSARKLSM